MSNLAVAGRNGSAVDELERDAGRLLADLSVLAGEEAERRRGVAAALLRATRESENARTVRLSDFRLRNAEAFLELARRQPIESLAETLGLSAKKEMLEAALDRRGVDGGLNGAPPVLVDAPREVRIGAAYAAIGVALGARGSVFLDILGREGVSTITAQVLEWSRCAVVFATDAAVGGIGYDSRATLRLVNAAGSQSNILDLVVQPAESRYVADSAPATEQGHYGVLKDGDFVSPPVPAAFRLLGPRTGADAIIGGVWTMTDGEPVDARFLAPPTYDPSSRALRARVRYGAAARHRFRVWVTFAIGVPRGFEVPGAWSRVC